jgi:hypothetical protein
MHKRLVTSNGKEIEIWDNLLSYKNRSEIYDFVKNSYFVCDGLDNSHIENSGHYNLVSNFSPKDLETSKLLKNVPEVFDKVKHYDINQVRVNLSTLNDKNHFHCDGKDDDKNFKTLIYYPNMKWDIEWGGYTLFANDDLTEIEHTLVYTPGRFILFDGEIPHCIGAPTNMAPSYRFTFVVQYTI